jgi:hypothetical protein
MVKLITIDHFKAQTEHSKKLCKKLVWEIEFNFNSETVCGTLRKITMIHIFFLNLWGEHAWASRVLVG